MPKKRLTEEGVAKLKAPAQGKQLDYYDAVMPGLVLPATGEPGAPVASAQAPGTDAAASQAPDGGSPDGEVTGPPATPAADPPAGDGQSA